MNHTLKNAEIEIFISNYEDIITARQKARELMGELGFSLLDQTRLVTAVSELARNIIVHAGDGRMIINRITRNGQPGIQCSFIDNGPGIPDIELALKGGYTTGRSLGLGLSGSKRLCDDFDISSSPGKGTSVIISGWIKK